MEKKTPSLLSIILWVLLAASLSAVFFLAPRTYRSYQEMQVQVQATPTPTANVQSVLLVTIDPNNPPSPTPMILKNGSMGVEVERLQERLKELQYYPGDVDGQYGQGTSAAVKLFQAQHQLTDDGLAGSDTLTALYAQNAQTYIPTPAPSPTPSKLEKGAKGGSVRELQTRLQELNFYTASVDGDYGNGTEAAVRNFQAQHNLTADGVATAETLALLNSGQASILIPTPTPDPATAPMLVNRDNPVPEQYKPGSLVNLRKTLPSDLVYVKGSDIEGDPTAVKALQDMLEAAKKDGVTSFQVSAGYRSIAYQQKLFDDSVASYISKGSNRAGAISSTRLTVADPGASEHHTGLAFDITVADTIFKGTPQQIWLHKHCWDYGFIIRYQEDKEKITGILAEAWHIRYVGVQHSIPMRDQNLCLEEYLMN